MRAVDIIRAKRDGEALPQEAITAFVAGVLNGAWADYQASALLMAIVLRGMTAQETAWLTDAMVRSGRRVDLSGIPGVKVGKHSTGGVGDKVSVILAPVVAACGVVMPKMSGRGLGHTGGTLDKLESIPGFRVSLSVAEFVRVLGQVGCAMVGQTSDIAPADKTEKQKGGTSDDHASAPDTSGNQDGGRGVGRVHRIKAGPGCRANRLRGPPVAWSNKPGPRHRARP